ncbi:YebG family protein [Arsukibacterium sp.]|uniref:YebG family protein n=1 Tax=Arsukibacterium sp. TaxID=1977258 RepID=UPI002FD8F91F
MAVIIKYVVERNGAEKMTFTSKAEADAFDKMLDTADELTVLLQASQLLADEQQTEALALYLAQHKDALLAALSAKKVAKPAKAEKAAPAEAKAAVKAA